MNKKILIIVLIFITSFSYAVSYKNPFWKGDLFNLVRIKNRFRPINIELIGSVSFDSIRAVYTGLFYELKSGIDFSDYLGLSNAIRLGENYPKFKILDLGSYFRPLSFFQFEFDYKYRDFSKYRIGEHDLLLRSEIPINPVKYVLVSLKVGVNFRFVDLDIYDYGNEYKKDWLNSIFFLWQLKLVFHPVFMYSFGFSLSNMDEYEVFSINYWQFEMINYFHLPEKISLFVNGGFAYAGSFPFAGIINRFWVRAGIRYEIKIH